MRKDFDEMYRLGLYGNGIERIKLKKAVQIIQKASASQVKIVDIGHDNFDSACAVSYTHLTLPTKRIV